MSEKQKRNGQIDILKAITIILVVFGHSIQYGSGSMYYQEQLYFDNSLFKLIYSFHMPLFMLLSGYLFYWSTVNHSCIYNIKSRISTLLLPLVTWNSILFFIKIAEADNFSVLSFMKMYVSTMIYNLWFLWAAFYCSMFVIIVKRIFNDGLWMYITGFALSFFIPDLFGIEQYKFMYPFFVIGYLFNKKYNKLNVILNRFGSATRKVFLLGEGYLILLFFYGRDDYIYTSGHFILNGSPIRQLSIDFYRIAVGLLGSAFVIILTEVVKNRIPRMLCESIRFIGKNSLGIYVISEFLFKYVLTIITTNLSHINYIATVFETIIIVTVSLLCSVAVRKSCLLNNLLLGGRV